MKKEFNPDILQPNYLIRQGLLKAFTRLSPRLKGRMLDFGCGTKPYQSLFSVDEYIGVDYENPGHSHLNEQIDVFYDGKTLPFEHAQFDSIFSSEVFEHVFNLPDILIELNRVLKRDGLLLLSCPFSFCEHEVPHDFARYTSFGIRHLLQEKGFEIVVQEKTGSTIETIHQLFSVYCYFNIFKKIEKIPVVRSAGRLFIFGVINTSAKIWGKLLPRDKTLYMNNIVLCRKVNEIASKPSHQV
ncbi:MULTISPECIES: class I SAM-dependent methyltransferase [Chitinophagaceae]|uniref:class I SAM-dependent methyltransferase n=1 Tax=Chitinophagaceae TaxID=563835 RepID=UPI000DEF5C6B|nr:MULTISPECIES: class I SAM-dependent methyltransferase [Chitinophagaceae]RPD51330.1 class I SAM-dependent methyltransferase [Paracnuella aquatica]